MVHPTRQTVARKALQVHLEKHPRPMSEIELRTALVSKGIVVHKTTMYRQLEALVADGWLTVTRFADGVARYERQHEHHHHIVCRACERVEEIQLDHHLTEVEQQIRRSHGYSHVTHALEFFGTCAACTRRKTPTLTSS